MRRKTISLKKEEFERKNTEVNASRRGV